MSKQSLPPNVCVNRGKNKDTYYYRTYENGKRTKIRIGHTMAEVMEALREIDQKGSILPKTLGDIWEIYRKDGLLVLAETTQKDYIRCWEQIEPIFGHINLADIYPQHIKQHLKARIGKTRANRERSLISILFNCARGDGFFNGANPCAGIHKNKEKERTKYIHDDEFAAIRSAAKQQFVRDAMDLMLYAGQRVSDTLRMRRDQIRGNFLFAKSTKTGRNVRILIEGEFKVVIDRLLNNAAKVQSIYLVHDGNGQPITLQRLEQNFARARESAGFKSFEIQLRDIRAKNASDDTSENANLRLMHTTTAMTDKYRRAHMGAVVQPLHKKSRS